MKQQYFDTAYSKARELGYSASDSLKIASKSLDNFEPQKVSVKKSFALDTSNYNTGNILDILVGYPEPDTEEIYGGKVLEYSGWNNVPNKMITADINHFMYDAKDGVRNDLEPKWQNFGIKISDWYIGEDGLRAKAYVPETDLGKEFLELYQKGEFGFSVEAEGYEYGNLIKDWEIKGGSFVTDPSYIKTKPKK